MEQVLVHARNLLQQGQYDSVELLGHFLISSKNTSVDAFILFADALYGNSHFPRAMHYYKQALAKVHPRTQVSPVETDLFLKIGSCCVKLRDDPSAISWLEKISPAQRTLSIHMQLARLHHASGAKIAANYYREALKINPYAMEAIYALVSLGEDPDVLGTFLDTSITSPSTLPTPAASSSASATEKSHSRTWLGLTAIALQIGLTLVIYGALHSQMVTKALPLYSKLLPQFPSNLHLLDLIGQCHALLDDDQNAMWKLQSIAKLDPFHESSMDLYAYLLKKENELLELNRLGHTLVRATAGARDAPQCWAVLGMYAEGKGNRERASELLDRAIAQGHARAPRSNAPLYDGSLARAYLSKADLLMAAKLPDQALHVYRRAHGITGGSLRSCQGLVTAHLALTQHKEAQRYANEATRRWPNSARAMTLLGLVLSQTPETRQKARKILADALTATPSCTDALLALANLHVVEGKLQEALDLLKGHMKLAKSEQVYLQIGEVCTQMRNYDESLAHYHLALAQNPASETAQKAIARLDMLMKGKDPDAPEVDEEEEEEEEEEDEEGEELEDDDDDMLE